MSPYRTHTHKLFEGKSEWKSKSNSIKFPYIPLIPKVEKQFL